MKKFLKVLATAAAVAAVVPFHGEGDKYSGEIKSLLWKANWKIDPERKTQSDINVLIGFNNPFEHFNKEADLFADDLVVDYCCDEGITPNTVIYRDEECECGCEAEAPAAEENCECSDCCAEESTSEE